MKRATLRVLLVSLAGLLAAGCAAATAPTPAATPAPGAASPNDVAAAPTPAPTIESDDPVVVRIVELGRTDSRVNPLLREMTEKFGPRLTGSHALMEAERWARDQFEGFGLEARLERWGDVPVGFDRGPWWGRMVAPEPMDLDFITPAWSPGIVGPHRAAAIAYPTSVKAVAKLEDTLKGAWVLYTPAVKELDSSVKDKIDAALVDAQIAGTVRPDRDKSGKLVHTSGDFRIDWGAIPSLVDVRLRSDQHKEILSRIEAGESVELEFSIDNRFFRGPVPQHNVVADIVGSEFPDEYVIVGGHIDSWDGAQGVIDNGTGVATTLEAARLLMAAGARPRRTIRFMLWGGEEQGLWGSRSYVDANPDIMPRISAVLVHDGGTNFLSGLDVTPEMAEAAKEAFAPVFDLDEKKPFGLYFAKQLTPGGSDHSPFIAAGVPGFFWRQSGDANYGFTHHTQHDTLEHLRPDYQKHSAMVVALGAWGLANLDGQLDRTDSAPLGDRRSGVRMSGLTLTEVKEGSSAYHAGFRSGDTLARFEGKDIKSLMDLLPLIRAEREQFKMTVKRKGKLVELDIDYSKDPSAEKRKEREARRRARFGQLEYGEPFAGRAAGGGGLMNLLRGRGGSKAKANAKADDGEAKGQTPAPAGADK